MSEPALNIYGKPIERVVEKVDDDEKAGAAKSDSLALVPAEPLQSSEPKSLHHRSTEYVVASGVNLCGDFGGIMNNGQPCTREAGFGFPDRTEGKCYLHSDDVLDDMTRKKRAFLSEYENQPMTVRMACEKVGVSSVTIWRWRKTDPEFDREMQAMLDVVDEVRTQGVEDASFLRATDPSNSADGLRQWWLENMRPHKFKNTKRVELTGKNGGAIENVNHNVRWNIDGGSQFFFNEQPNSLPSGGDDNR